MKNLTFLIIAAFISATVVGQEIYLEQGMNVTNFEFLESSGDSFKTFHPKTNNAFGVGYRHFIEDGFSFAGGLSFVEFGSLASDLDHDNDLDYSLSYLQLNVGGEYEFYSIKDQFNVYAKGVFSVSRMLTGTRVGNYQVVSLIDDEDFGPVLLSGYLGLKLSTSLTDRIDIYSHALVGINDPSGVSRTSEVERLRIKGANVAFGIVFDLITE